MTSEQAHKLTIGDRVQYSPIGSGVQITGDVISISPRAVLIKWAGGARESYSRGSSELRQFTLIEQTPGGSPGGSAKSSK